MSATFPALETPHPKAMLSREFILDGDNPFNFGPDVDRLYAPQYDVKNYSETMWFTVWSPKNGVGLFLHTGRVNGHIDLWWARAIAYLPNGRLVVDRSFGHAIDDSGPRTGNLTIQNISSGKNGKWSLRFDGAGEDTTRKANRQSLSGAGPYVPMQFDIDVTGAAPIWDLVAATHDEKESQGAVWMSRHTQQGHLAKGKITVGGESWDVDGIAYRDHSAGPRDMAGFGADSFVAAVFPKSGRVMNALQVWDIHGNLVHRSFYIYENGKMEMFRVGGVPRAPAIEDRDVEFVIAMRRLNGEELIVKVRTVHGVIIAMNSPNVQRNGVPADTSGTLLLMETPIEIIWPDGEIGYGACERSLRPAQNPS